MWVGWPVLAEILVYSRRVGNKVRLQLHNAMMCNYISIYYLGIVLIVKANATLKCKKISFDNNKKQYIKNEDKMRCGDRVFYSKIS